MLQIKDVRKKYVTGGFEQIALDGVSLNLRDNEFVAILGPSGSGKTTLLNIIGGLDRYDSGDLVIGGVSTKKYKDRDWDSYRNHTVGFVFQSYNLIPHQTVLANVELALTIGGISAAQRKQRAMDALAQVGLADQAHKKPNQMSGGQMQRVAIARALVNNPKILLADEPTGALDTKTSVQVMELLKEVARDRLVVMVTHNPELAEEYANRIVRLKDGSIMDDTNPLIVEEDIPAIHKNLGRASMSLPTSFGLSLNNLMTKKGRTLLTAFAGSIGIIGIALILSLSTGFQNYIDQIQEETMTSYPLTIYEEASDVLSALFTMHSDHDEEPEEGVLKEEKYIETMMGSIAKNDLEYFKQYLEDHEDEYSDDVSMITYSYSVTPLIYTIDAADNMAQINPNATLNTYLGTSSSYLSSLTGSSMTSAFSEIEDIDAMKEDYTLLAGEWPDEYDELVAVVSDPNQISDMLLYTLGFRDTKELKTLIQNVMSGDNTTTDHEPMELTYEDFMDLELKLIDPTALYRYNEEYDIYEDMSDDEDYMAQVYEEAEDLHIVGICWSEESSSDMSAGVMYLPSLTYHVIDIASGSEIVQKQLADEDTDVFSGKAFDDEDEDSGLDFGDMISIDEDALSGAFQTNIDTSALSGLGSSDSSSSIDEEAMQTIIMGAAQEVTDNLESVTQSMVQALTAIDQQVAESMIEGYTSAFTMPVPVSSGGDSGTDSSSTDSGSAADGDSGLTGQSYQSGAGAQALQLSSVTYDSSGAFLPLSEVMEGSEVSEIQSAAETIQAQPETSASSMEGSTILPAEDDDENGEGGDGNEDGDGDDDNDTDGTGSDSTYSGDISGLIGGETANYLMLSANGVDTAEAYKAQAMTDEMFENLASQMSASMEGMNISAANLKKITEEAFDIYVASLTPNAMGMVPEDEIPDPSSAVAQAIANNESLIFEEAYDLAKSYTTLLVAQGVGNAVNDIMTPVMSSMSESLSGLSAISDMFSGDFLTIDTDKFAEAFNFDMDEDELSRLMESMLTGEDASYTNNLLDLGYQDLDKPTSISFYFKDFEAKGRFTDWLEAYNEAADEDHELTYSDLTGLLMSSVETIINSVTYVLIAFVSISLIVSSIMIGIITYISVLERTKEIGILRAIGASKRNISTIFNAETFIIGFLSGLIGVGLTCLLNIPINAVIHNVTDNMDIVAVLQPAPAVALVIISTLLTMLGGLIPSRSASKKDPVIALRTE